MIVERVRESSRRRRRRWESYCLQCGTCCYEKDGSGLHVVTNFKKPCIYLNTRTHRCTVYENRFDMCPACRRMTLHHALFVRWLPETCGYVRRFRYHERLSSEVGEG